MFQKLKYQMLLHINHFALMHSKIKFILNIYLKHFVSQNRFIHFFEARSAIFNSNFLLRILEFHFQIAWKYVAIFVILYSHT